MDASARRFLPPPFSISSLNSFFCRFFFLIEREYLLLATAVHIHKSTKSHTYNFELLNLPLLNLRLRFYTYALNSICSLTVLISPYSLPSLIIKFLPYKIIYFTYQKEYRYCYHTVLLHI